MQEGSNPGRIKFTPGKFFSIIEKSTAFLALILITLLLLIEVISRKFLNTGVPNSREYIQHLVLWVAFLGAMIATGDKKNLTASLVSEKTRLNLKIFFQYLTCFLSVSMVTVFFISSISFFLLAFDRSAAIGIFPIQYIVIIIPTAFFFIIIRFILQTPRRLTTLFVAAGAVLTGILLSINEVLQMLQGLVLLNDPENLDLILSYDDLIESFNALFLPVFNVVFWPLAVILIASIFTGTPIFIVLGGLAVLFFINSEGSLAIIPNQAYVVFTGENIPAIPLFTLAGFILSESRAGERFVNLFRSLLGWLPGGFAIVTVFICAFFTTFTGATGVTILALGGLLAPVLIARKYKKNFTYGLLTAGGSIGLLLPPSLPIILYGVQAQISIKDLLINGVFPGLFMIAVVAVMGVHHAVKNKIERVKFKIEDVAGPFLSALPEILLPFIILISYFTGITTLVETGALAVLYVLFIEIVVHRELKFKDLVNIMDKSLPIIGGVLIILALANGLSYYIIDQQIPQKLTEWCQSTIESRLVFLFLLNVGLLITGCFLDIFSAILVVAPLVIPLGVAYGIDPIHLGIIFLANLQLGYLTPPVGLNLFLAAYRFDRPLSKIYTDVLPVFIVLLIVVLYITYVPLFFYAY
ncbi:MAG: TRAP transporter large permease subunit [Spirochaetales bacterium]|nr:TRAP transporter large permease subunit [Spirochaetales bacterium]